MSDDARRFWERVARLRYFALVVAAYIVGLFPLWFVWEWIEDGGGPPNVWVPYYFVYGLLFGATVGRWWLLAFPVLHRFAEPLWNRIEHGADANITYAYDREAMAMAATAGILAGLVIHRLVLVLIRQRGARQEQPGLTREESRARLRARATSAT